MYYVISVNIQQYRTHQLEQHSFIATQIKQSLSWHYELNIFSPKKMNDTV